MGIRVVVLMLSAASWSHVAAQVAPADPPETLDPNELSADADEAEARMLFERGTAALEAGRIRDALRDYERVHELTGRVEFLFNIGLAHQRLGNVSVARDHFERYLVATPDATNRSDVEARIVELRSLEDVAEPEEPPVESRVESLVDLTAEADSPVPADAPSESRGVGPLLLGLSGAAIAVGGSVLFGVGAARTGTLNDSQGREWADVAADQDGARTLQIVGLSVAAIGVAAATAALIWMLTSKKDERGELSWRF